MGAPTRSSAKDCTRPLAVRSATSVRTLSQTAGAEEGLVVVGDGVGDIDVRRVVDADDGAFGANGAEAHQLHGVSCGVRCPDHGWVARPVQPGRARNRLPDKGNSSCSAGESSPRAVVISSWSSSGPTKARLVVCGAGQLDHVEQVTGGGVAAHLSLAPRGQPEVAGCVDAQAVGHRVGDLQCQASCADGSAGLVVVTHPDLTARDAVDAVEQGVVGGERHPVGEAEVVVEHRGRVAVRAKQPLGVPRSRQRRGADQEAPSRHHTPRRSTGRPDGR